MCAENIYWVPLSSLRTTTILKVGYFGVVSVPLISFIILGINEYFPALTINLPYSMFWLFIGSVLLSVAHFLNETLCPSIIKIHGSLDEYRGSLASLLVNQEIILQAHTAKQQSVVTDKVKEIFPSLNEKDIERLATGVANAIGKIVMDSERKELPLVDYSKKWDDENSSYNKTRIAITVLYMLSALIALILISRHIFIVSNATFA